MTATRRVPLNFSNFELYLYAYEVQFIAKPLEDYWPYQYQSEDTVRIMAPSHPSARKSLAPSYEAVQERYLRPHHIPLLGLIFWMLNCERRLRLTMDYMLHMMRILLVEVSEVNERLCCLSCF